MSFLLLIFIIVFCFVIWPLLRAALIYWRIKQNFNNRHAAANFGKRTSQQPGKRKIIGNDVGEYVDFEDIAPDKSQYSDVNPDISSQDKLIENQISDVEWEDI